MFRIGNVQGITKYLLLGVLTLSSECLAAVNRAQYWEDDDNIYFFTTRRPYIWEWFTDAPTSKPAYESFDSQGRAIFFVVLFISVIIISFIIYLCRKHWNDAEQQYTNTISGAIVHPPPRHLGPSSLSSANSRPLLSFYNIGYQNESPTVGGRPVDMPPDYGTVVINDLTAAEKYNYPIVIPKVETPPPKYQDGYPIP